MAESPCPFCQLTASGLVWSDALVVAILARFPVSPGHTLVLPRRHVPAAAFRLRWEPAVPEAWGALGFTRALVGEYGLTGWAWVRDEPRGALAGPTHAHRQLPAHGRLRVRRLRSPLAEPA